MGFRLLVLILGLSQGPPLANAGPGPHTGWFGSTSEQQHDSSGGGGRDTNRAQRSIAAIPERVSRLTVSTLTDNMTRVVEDSGKYYTWRSFGPGEQHTHNLWVDMNDAHHGQVRVHAILSNSYKQAVKVALSFDFPFYGHYLRQVTIATGGFIFTGDVTHRMLTATQYIAPIMADFDPSFSRESTVQYLDDGDVFVVQWGLVRLSGREDIGAFTFQTALHKTGIITFSYRDIPRSLDVISTSELPVTAGLSDAFMVTSSSSPSSDARQKIIYEYHRVEIDHSIITNHSAVEFTPLPTCLQHKSCELCLSSSQTSGCSWCNVLQRCSDGMDRHRQEWMDYSCSEGNKNATCEDYSEDSSVTSQTEAPPTALNKACQLYDDTKHHLSKTDIDVDADASAKKDGTANIGVIAGIAAALLLLLALILLALYITCHPATASSPLYVIPRRKSYWTSLKFEKQQPGYREVEGEGHEKDCIVEAAMC